jgi:DNA-binding transcriptional regulator GbsR (MarR family)
MARAAGAEEQERDWVIEQMGLACEADGFTRIAGRIFGLLLLSAEPYSLDDIADILDISKASASTEARRLLDRNFVLRHMIEGDRRDYYEMAPDFFRALMHIRVSHWSRMHQLANSARDRISDLPPTVQDRLDYVNTATEFILELIDGALAQWDQRVSPLAPKQSKAPARRRASKRQSP